MNGVGSGAAEQRPVITYDEFNKLDLRTGVIVEAKDHPNADKLLILKVAIGAVMPANHEGVIQVIAGLKAYYKPEALLGQQVIVLTNLAPRNMRGEVSNGMLLATTDSVTNTVELVTTVTGKVTPGSEVK